MRVFSSDDISRVALWKNVVLLIVRRNWTIPGIQTWHKAIDRAIRTKPRGYLTLSVIEAGAIVLHGSEREALLHTVRTRGQSCVCSAVVVEGTGFVAAASRTVVTGLNLLTRPTFPNKLFDDRRDAVEWLAGYGSHAGETFDPSELLNALNELSSK